MTVEASDRGLLLGDGLFETVLWTDGRLDRFDAHAARLIAGCEVLDLPAPAEARLRAAAMEAISRGVLETTRAAVRLTWTAGPGGRGLDRPPVPTPVLLATAAPSPSPVDAVRLATVSVRRNEGSLSSRLKTLAYLDNVLARREALRLGAEEALMLNNRGEITCAAAANLFWFEADMLITPTLECGVLDGVMRRAVIEQAGDLGIDVREVRSPSSALAAASGLFLTNSLIGVRAVASLDGNDMPSHPLTAQLKP